MRLAGLLTAACFALVTQPGVACSFRWKPGYSPKEIPYRADVWKVKGDFTLIDAKTGAPVQTGEEINLTKDGIQLLGRITRRGHKPIQTKQYYSEISVECGANLNPLGSETGTFWMEKKRDKDGRYRLLMWRPAKQKPSPATAEATPAQSNGNQ